MLVSRNSAAGMQIRPGPAALADVELQALEGAFESLALTPLFTGGGVISGDFFEVIADHASQCGITIDGDFAEFFDEFLVEREGDVHAPIIRETLISCKWISLRIRWIFGSGLCRTGRPTPMVLAGYWSGRMGRAGCE